MTAVAPLPVIPAAHFGHGIALFDLDRTVVPGSSLVVLGRELVRRGLLERAALARYAVAAASFRRRGLRSGEVGRLLVSMLAALAGREHAPVIAALPEVTDRLDASVYPAARWLVRRHRDAGDFCVLLTAAPQELADAVSGRLGLHRAVGTRLEVDGGRFTGRLDGPFCFGEGKLERMRTELGAFDLELATAYADSGSDLPLLASCGSAIAVNPDRALLAVAQRGGWPVLRFDPVAQRATRPWSSSTISTSRG